VTREKKAVEAVWVVGETRDGTRYVVDVTSGAAFEIVPENKGHSEAEKTGRGEAVVPIGKVSSAAVRGEAIRAVNEHSDETTFISAGRAAEIIGVQPSAIRVAVMKETLRVARTAMAGKVSANEFKLADVIHYRDTIAGSGRPAKEKKHDEKSG